MIVARAVFGRWVRLLAAIGGGLGLLLATTQLRRWLASDRSWSAMEWRRLAADTAAMGAVALAVAATLAAIEVAIRLRRDGLMTTLCMAAAAPRTLGRAGLAMAAATGCAIACATAAAAACATPVAALARTADGWLWQPWPDVAAITVRAGAATWEPANAVAVTPWLAGCAGAAAVASAFAFAATTTARGRLWPHLVALDALAVAAALWMAAPAAAALTLAAAGALAWWTFVARGPRRIA